MKALLLIERPMDAHITIYAPGKTLPEGYEAAIEIGPTAMDTSHIEVVWQDDTFVHLVIAECEAG